MSLLEAVRTQISNAFNEILSSAETFEELDQLCSKLGIEFDLSAKTEGQIGAKGYWKKIRAIAEEKGVSRKEARALYSNGHSDSDNSNGRSSSAVANHEKSLKASKLRKKYWRAVHKIVDEEGVDVKRAQEIYKQKRQVA